MKIKPFKKPPAPPADLYDRTFSLLLSATNAILHKKPLVHTYSENPMNAPSSTLPSAPEPMTTNPRSSPTSVAPPSMFNSRPSVSMSREELYRSVEDLCVHGHSTKLYGDVCQVLENGALYCLQKLTNNESNSTWAPGAVSMKDSRNTKVSNVVFHQTFAPSHDSLRILSSVREIYSDYLEYLTFVRSIFLYLDRSFVLGKTQVNSLWDAGIDTFRRHAMFNPDANAANNVNRQQTSTVIQTVISSTLYQIKCEREGKVVDRALVRSIIRMLADLPGCFTNQLMPQFVAESMAYFEREGKKWLESSNSGSTSEFLAHVERRWNQANEMSVYYLDCSAAKLKNSEEDDTATKALLESTTFSGKEIRTILAAVVEQHLLLPHVESFLLQDKSLYPMLDNDSKLEPDLKRLYILLSKVSKLDVLRSAFGKYGRITGIKIIQGSSGASTTGKNAKEVDKEIIPNILKWKERLETIQKVGFLEDDTFGYSTTSTNEKSQQNSSLSTGCLRGVLEDVLNGSHIEYNKSHNADEYGKRVAELLAKHVDLCLRSAKTLAMPNASTMLPKSGSYKPNASDPERFLDKIMSVFRYLQSKDIFEAFFKRDLARRLLLSKSASVDLERSFISKLKTECGTGYTSKMEGMFKDMELSREVMSHYMHETNLTRPKIMQHGEKPQEAVMDVQILTTGYWPVYQQFKEIKLPSPLLNPLTAFETHYKNKYQGRRIVWQHSLGNCQVRARFPNGEKDLLLSQYQTLVLVWCFGEMEDEISDDSGLGKGWVISEIIAKTGIEDKGECERVLQSLSVGKEGTRVLIKKDSKGDKRKKERRSVMSDDTFHFNHNFTSRLNRIRIPSLQSKETAQERDDTRDSVSRDRLNVIDAAIVRIMKARKTILHQTLLGEVMNQLRFPATGNDIKKRIECLLDREYMERSIENRGVYNYIA